jgi:hypothetical protein
MFFVKPNFVSVVLCFYVCISLRYDKSLDLSLSVPPAINTHTHTQTAVRADLRPKLPEDLVRILLFKKFGSLSKPESSSQPPPVSLKQAYILGRSAFLVFFRSATSNLGQDTAFLIKGFCRFLTIYKERSSS